MGGTACAAVTTGDLGSPRRGCPSGHFQGSSRSASGAVREEEPTPRDQTQPPAEPLRKVRRLRDEMLGDEERRLSATEIAALAGDPSSTSPATMPRRPRDLGTRMDVRRLVSAEIYPEWAGENSQGQQLPNGTYFVILSINGGDRNLQGYVDLRR